jgi:hypothetical protein
MPSPYNFQFVVSGVTLGPETIKRVSEAIAQAGAAALADDVDEPAVTVELRPGVIWRGLPPAEVARPLVGFVTQEVGNAGPI